MIVGVEIAKVYALSYGGEKEYGALVGKSK